MQQRRGTEAQWTSANPVLGAGEIGFETDTGKFKIGDGVNEWGDLAYFLNLDELGGSLDDYVPLTQRGANNGVATLDGTGNVPLAQLGNIIDGSPEALNTLNELAAAINDNPNFYESVADLTTNVNTHTGLISNLTTDFNSLDSTVDGISTDLGNLITDFNSLDSAVDGISTDLGNLTTDFNNTVSGISTDLGNLTTDINELNTDLGNLTTTVTNLDTNKASLESPTFTGTVTLPSTTSIGDVSATELGYINGVTSDIQTQIDGKLATSTASSTYAPLSAPTFTGTVTLPSTTSIGNVTSTEIAYLDGVTSAIQTQLDAKAPTASPTFTGTVSGITATMVGLGNVDNTSDANKPVSTATQTALDGKLSLSGGTMTGALTLSGAPTQANHAATKAYADSISEGLHVHASCVAATTANVNLSNALENGDVLDGVTLVTGDRVLVKNQSTASENGIYVVQASGAALRASDFNEPLEVDGGDFVFVTGGTVNDNTGWVQTATNVVTIGTDPITFVQFAGAGTITAGTNISVNGSEISVVNNPTFSGLITASSGVAFSDGTQTKVGVPSITEISQKTDSYTLAALTERDTIIEISKASATTLTIPADSTVNFPVGTTLDIIQTGAGQVTVAGAGGVTVNATPGLKLRAQWSSATLLKRAANTWLVFGDLSS